MCNFKKSELVVFSMIFFAILSIGVLLIIAGMSINNKKEYNNHNFSITKNNNYKNTHRITENHERALTNEEAEALRGTGYHGTRPNSSAELIEINAAKVKCKNCGMRSHNGANSLCDSCKEKSKNNK